jgi:hypothetical protein
MQSTKRPSKTRLFVLPFFAGREARTTARLCYTVVCKAPHIGRLEQSQGGAVAVVKSVKQKSRGFAVRGFTLPCVAVRLGWGGYKVATCTTPRRAAGTAATSVNGSKPDAAAHVCAAAALAAI